MSNRKVTDKRIPDSSIVGAGPTVIYDDDPDLFLYDLSKIVIKKRGASSTANYIASPPSSSGGILAQFANQASVISSERSFENLVEKIDTIDLTDIENIAYEQYYDQVSKLVKYKVILKIRNSSSKKNNVSGVDARIYNPNA